MLVSIVIWIASAMVASNVAEAKGLDGSSWSLAAFFFGPIGLIGVAGMPDRRLRSYVRAVAVKLEAIEQQDIASIESMQQLPATVPAVNDSAPQYFYVNPMLRTDEERIASVLSQFPEEERSQLSAEESNVNIGRMSFICRSDGRVFARLKYIDLKDGKHVFKRT